MIEEIVDFWFDPIHKPAWFDASDAFDQLCRDRFARAVEAAGRGEHDPWLAEPQGALALVLLTDQFPRNIWRGTAKAFALDPKARAVADAAITMQHDLHTSEDRRMFFYLPFEHSEDISDQERSLQLFATLGDDKLLNYARRHHDIIRRFGRFPHRNAMLDRPSTPEEEAFLKEPGSRF